jgi:ATP-dependent protease ClpP protease subunit
MNSNMKLRLANRGVGEFRAEAGVIWLYDVIAQDDEDAMWGGGVSPRQFIAALDATTGPVIIRVNSPGGSVFGAQAMVAAMRACEHLITVQIDSLAASAASVIACAASHVQMAPGSMMMIHKAWGAVMGNEDELRATADLLQKIDGQIAASYAGKAGGDADEYLALMAAETWFTADEALAAGLADEVIEANNQKPKAAWDLSVYANAPAMPEAATPDAVESIQEQEALAPVIAPDMRATRERQLAARLVANAI